MQLSIGNISKTYPNGVRALNDVSLTIPPGMFGLLGPNGAGKSTLMRMIATLQDPWANYRKGPYAMHALSEYVGEKHVNGALRSLVERKASSLATTLDLYRELQTVTPDSLRSLLHDLFEVNAWWTFDTKRATAAQTEAGTWQVTLEVEARKVVADSAGVEREAPMNEWVEIGIFAPAEPGEVLGKPLYVQKHPIASGRQTIAVAVPQQPARAGIDPCNLLDWEEGDNIEPVTIERASAKESS